MNFGKRLKSLRTGQKWTQQKLADRLGVAKSIISYYESSERFPSYDVLIKIARTFHTTTDYLLGLEHERVIDAAGLKESEIAAITALVEIMQEKHKTGQRP